MGAAARTTAAASRRAEGTVGAAKGGRASRGGLGSGTLAGAAPCDDADDAADGCATRIGRPSGRAGRLDALDAGKLDAFGASPPADGSGAPSHASGRERGDPGENREAKGGDRGAQTPRMQPRETKPRIAGRALALVVIAAASGSEKRGESAVGGPTPLPASRTTLTM